MAADFGSDILVLPDLNASLTPVTGPRAVVDGVARMLLTPRGSLPFHPNRGIDIRDFLGESITDDALFRLKSQVEAECEKDERISAAQASVEFLPARRQLKVRVSLQTAEGPFRFVLAVTALTVDLFVEEA